MSGDVTLTGMYREGRGVYVNIVTPRYGNCEDVMFRTVGAMDDYSGGHNQWLSFDKYKDEYAIADYIKERTI